MKQLIAIVLAGLIPSGVLAQSADETAPLLEVRTAQDVALDEYLWLNRLIVVFANTERDPAFQKQLDLLTARPGDLLERDVVVITDTDPTGQSAIRDRLRPRGFGLVLIDKDGLIKLRKPSPWDVREISRSIDKTDLRQQELRDQRAVPIAEP